MNMYTGAREVEVRPKTAVLAIVINFGWEPDMNGFPIHLDPIFGIAGHQGAQRAGIVFSSNVVN